MASLSAAAVCILCAAQPAPPAPQVARWHPFMAEASSRFVIPESWIAQVIQAESAGRTVLNGRPITSAAGAQGLMQVMPGTYTDMRRQYGLGSDPFDPHDNILAGAAFLRAMYDRYGYPNLFAAYHAGPGRFDDFLWHRRPLPKTTIAYADSIVPGSFSGADQAAAEQELTLPNRQNPSTDALFFATGTISATTNSSSTRAARSTSTTQPNSGALFVPLSSRAP